MKTVAQLREELADAAIAWAAKCERHDRIVRECESLPRGKQGTPQREAFGCLCVVADSLYDETVEMEHGMRELAGKIELADAQAATEEAKP